MQMPTFQAIWRRPVRRISLHSLPPAVWLASISLLLLAACTTPLSIAPGTPEAQVRARFGTPAAEYHLAGMPEGSRLEYDTGVTGQRTYMVDFGPDGRAVKAWQPLTVNHFAQIRPGWTPLIRFSGNSASQSESGPPSVSAMTIPCGSTLTPRLRCGIP